MDSRLTEFQAHPRSRITIWFNNTYLPYLPIFRRIAGSIG